MERRVAVFLHGPSKVIPGALSTAQLVRGYLFRSSHGLGFFLSVS